MVNLWEKKKSPSFFQLQFKMHNISFTIVTIFGCTTQWASLVAQIVKNLPAMQETWAPSLGQEDPQEKGKAAHSSVLAWRIPWTKDSGGL